MNESPDTPVCRPGPPADVVPVALPPFPDPRVARPCELPFSPALTLGFELRTVHNLIIDTEFFYIDFNGDSYVDEFGNFYLEN